MPTVSHILPKVLAESPSWSQLIAIMDQVVGETARHRIDAMSHQRDMDYVRRITTASRARPEDPATGISYLNLSDDALSHLSRIAAFIGYSYRDGGVLTAEEYYRFVDGFSAFIPYAGTNLFLDFFSYLVGGDLDIEPLWLDLRDGTLKAENDPEIAGRRAGVDGGMEVGKDALPTPYINVLYPEEIYGRIQEPEAQNRLFYSISPLHIVVHDRIVDTTFARMDLYLHAAGAGLNLVEHEVNFAPLELEVIYTPKQLAWGSNTLMWGSDVLKW